MPGVRFSSHPPKKGFMKTKDIRLHHISRLKNNRNHYWGLDLTHDDRRSGIVVDTPAPCSCWMCGNPRKYFGHRTLQEISFDEVSKLE